jgi:PIN domain nuclease of toxin-antitoxin system
MSALLLDTHVWLWYAQGDDEQLSPKAVNVLDEARKSDGLLVSAISVWEIGMQQAKGRIQLSMPLRDWVLRALTPGGISVLPLDADTAAESALLPGKPHGDPADRFLIAAARAQGLILATRDRSIIAYGKAGHVRILAV